MQLVEIINSQRHAIMSVSELREHLVNQGVLIEIGRCGWQFRTAVCTGGVTNRVEQGQPELLGVVLVSPHLDEGKPMRPARLTGPGP